MTRHSELFCRQLSDVVRVLADPLQNKLTNLLSSWVSRSPHGEIIIVKVILNIVKVIIPIVKDCDSGFVKVN